MGLSSKQVSSDHNIEFNWSSTTQNMMLTSSEEKDILIQTSSSNQQQRSTPMKRSLQTKQQQSADPLKCPRCDSTNTKFCYYNNYNKTQPRHFCKACKRHWTKGGTLRNVPIGGSGRKNKRIKRTANATTVDHSLGLISDQKFIFPHDHHKGNLFFKAHDSEFMDQVSSWDFNTITTMQQSPTTHQNLGFSSVHPNNLTSSIHHTNPVPIIPTTFGQLLSDFKDDSTRMIMPSVSHEAASYMQQVSTTTSNFLEPNYWTWNDIDSMVQADLNKPFQDHK